MASALRKSFLNFALNGLQRSHVSRALSSLNSVALPLMSARGSTRISSLGVRQKMLNSHASVTNSNHLRVRAVHTEADSKLTEFLDEEISRERETAPETVNKIEGWTVETDGTGVILRKKFKDESIKVEFDVNDSVVEDDALFDEPPEVEASSDSPKMICRPPFEVEIKKKSGRSLTFLCEFSSQGGSYEPEAGEEIEDQFSIMEVRVDQPSDANTKENFYSHSSAVMDGNLYESLMDMLDERGIDDTFVTSLENFATSFEQGQYLNFLEKLQEVIKEN